MHVHGTGAGLIGAPRWSCLPWGKTGSAGCCGPYRFGRIRRGWLWGCSACKQQRHVRGRKGSEVVDCQQICLWSETGQDLLTRCRLRWCNTAGARVICRNKPLLGTDGHAEHWTIYFLQPLHTKGMPLHTKDAAWVQGSAERGEMEKEHMTYHWPLDDTYLAPAVSLTNVLVGMMPACASVSTTHSVNPCKSTPPSQPASLPQAGQQNTPQPGSSRLCRGALQTKQDYT